MSDNHRAAGRGDLNRAIQEIGNAALRSHGFTSERKHEIALQLGFLATEAVRAQDQRTAATIKPVLKGLRLVLCTSADMLHVWDKWGATLVQFFGTAQVGSAADPGLRAPTASPSPPHPA